MSADKLLFINLVEALLITEIIELLGAYILRVHKKDDFLCIAAVNASTNLPLNFILGLLRKTYPPSRLLAVIILGEAAVFLFEAFVYAKRSINSSVNPVSLSIILNAVSFTIGSVLLLYF